jgi:four helix bundle protein
MTGSLNGLETQLEIANRIGFLAQEPYEALLSKMDILGRRLNVLKRKIWV